MLEKYKFFIFNLVFLTVFGIIFIIGYTRPIPDAEAIQSYAQSGQNQNQPPGCLWCP